MLGRLPRGSSGRPVHRLNPCGLPGASSCRGLRLARRRLETEGCALLAEASTTGPSPAQAVLALVPTYQGRGASVAAQTHEEPGPKPQICSYPDLLTEGHTSAWQQPWLAGFLIGGERALVSLRVGRGFRYSTEAARPAPGFTGEGLPRLCQVSAGEGTGVCGDPPQQAQAQHLLQGEAPLTGRPGPGKMGTITAAPQ